MASAKLAIEVVAGLVPGQPLPEYTRRWVWSSDDQQALENGDKAAREKYLRMAGESREYAASLEDPRSLNWVQRVWLWF